MIIDAADLAEIVATESHYAGGRPSLQVDHPAHDR
jgi:hypothetical protein